MKQPLYAQQTTVSVAQSQMEIQNLLQKWGADKFGVDWKNNAIVFDLKNRSVQISVPMPNRNDFLYTPTNIARKEPQIEAAYDQAVRQRWRALILVLKAKMEAIAAGITTLEKEFLPDILLPNHQTMAQYLIPQLTHVELFPQLPQSTPKDVK